MFGMFSCVVHRAGVQPGLSLNLFVIADYSFLVWFSFTCFYLVCFQRDIVIASGTGVITLGDKGGRSRTREKITTLCEITHQFCLHMISDHPHYQERFINCMLAIIM